MTYIPEEKLGYYVIFQSGFKQAINQAAKFGFKVVEVHLTTPIFSPEKYLSKDRRLIKKYAQDKKIELQCHLSWAVNLFEINPETVKANQKIIKQAIIFAKDIGADRITFHLGKPIVYHDVYGKKIFLPAKFPKVFLSQLDKMLSFTVKEAKGKVLMCLENSDYFNQQTQPIVAKYLNSGLYLCWDLAKSFVFKDKSFFKKHLSKIRTVHLHGSINHQRFGPQTKKFEPLLKIIKDREIYYIIELMPFPAVLQAKKWLENKHWLKYDQRN